MHKYELSRIGEFHVNHNEDSSAIVEIGENKLLVAVMDGCSMGKESHFASILIAKILRKVSKELSYREFVEKKERRISELLREVMNRLFGELRLIKNQLLLDREDILSTIILGVLDEVRQEVEVLIIGDGLICCNGELYEYDQNDKPDYIGYHLDEDFMSWFRSQSQKLSLKNVRDLSIATDGIFTFKKFDNKSYKEIEEGRIVEYLLINRSWGDQENMLGKKLSEIETEFGLKPSDDLTILRIINN